LGKGVAFGLMLLAINAARTDSRNQKGKVYILFAEIASKIEDDRR